MNIIMGPDGFPIYDQSSLPMGITANADGTLSQDMRYYKPPLGLSQTWTPGSSPDWIPYSDPYGRYITDPSQAPQTGTGPNGLVTVDDWRRFYNDPTIGNNLGGQGISWGNTPDPIGILGTVPGTNGNVSAVGPDTLPGGTLPGGGLPARSMTTPTFGGGNSPNWTPNFGSTGLTGNTNQGGSAQDLLGGLLGGYMASIRPTSPWGKY